MKQPAGGNDILPDSFVCLRVGIGCYRAPDSLKRQAIVSLPIMVTAVSVNEYCLIASTSVVMKCIEKLVLSHNRGICG